MELKRLTAQVDDAEAAIARLRVSQEREHDAELSPQQQDERHIESAKLLQQVQAIQPDINVKMQKFVDKLSWKDPITNEPRYGPAMQEKIQALQARVTILQDAVTAAAGVVEVKASRALHNVQTREEEDRAREARRLEEVKAQEAEEARKEWEVAAAAEKAREEEKRVAEAEREALAKAAQAVRDERARVQAEKERLETEAKRALEELNTRIPVGQDGLQMALGMLARHFENDGKKRLEATKTLFLLLKNICAAPENPLFRHIKASNEHFARDLGQYPGGVQSLLALGFRPLTQPDGDIVYVLEEPDLAADLDAWSTWFETLKSQRDYVDEHLQKLK
ncbi:Aste57867_25251 [Aphanomyces stellatus]|uniref:Aste57867_25251 protein n=1 Tax=Aphanomyces stellatus TaxID=120398 RepID=A0A485LTZ8_9STRA|nr:hypothetical protein As57867_025173 [Aphanomyces stellatus]VFU01877.1 Aste57867_25251 [Aphanomyces stellatus]